MPEDVTERGGVAAEPGHNSRPRVLGLVQRWLRRTVGILLGAATALVDLGYLVCAGLLFLLAALHPRTRAVAVRVILAGARRLARWQRWRLAVFVGDTNATGYDARRVISYLAVRWLVGLLGGLVLLLFLYGLATGGFWLWHWITGRTSGYTFGSQLIVGLVLAFIIVHGLNGIAELDRRVGRRLLGPSSRDALERRITELATSRAGVVAAVDAERRRIERDLHDGVQQRMVALGMLVGRARRSSDPTKAAELLRQAHEESGQILGDLREVAWRVYPTALDNLGLADVLDRVAERAGLPVWIDYRLTDRPPRAVETAAYFVICEAVTNAAKHARATRVTVEVAARADRLIVVVADDGVGGADPTGGGLSGLARRVAALDGRLRVESPTGGPTSVVAELPCG